jgi:hypothetical protein
MNVQFGDNDVFNLFDVLAFLPHGGLQMVQVKTNRAAGVHEWCRDVEPFRRAVGMYPVMAVRHDNDGWRLIEPRKNGHKVVYDGRGWADANGGKKIEERFAAYLWNEVRQHD